MLSGGELLDIDMQYAHYNPATPSPAPVLGWYDTTQFEYQNLPAETGLAEVTEAQWAMHFNDPSNWVVANGVLTELPA